MTKLSDLTNIKERKPLLLYVPQPDDIPVLHIVRREGTHPKGNYEENITNCGRALQYASVYTQKEFASFKVRFCTRCGVESDFRAALVSYHQWTTVVRRKNQEIQEQLEAEEERRWQSYLRELEVLQDLIEKFKIFPTVLDKENGRLVIQTSEHEEEWLQVVQYQKR